MSLHDPRSGVRTGHGALGEDFDWLGRNTHRELNSRLEVLIAHLLKSQHQPHLRDGSAATFERLGESMYREAAIQNHNVNDLHGEPVSLLRK